MAIRVVQLGAPRTEGEGLRLGTVRHPPCGVPRAEFASRNYYDVWFPNLAPSAAIMQAGKSAGTEAHCHRSILRDLLAERGADCV